MSSPQLRERIGMAAIVVGLAIFAVVAMKEGFTAPQPTTPQTQLDIVTPPTVEIENSRLAPTSSKTPRVLWADDVPHLFFHPLVTDVQAFRKGRIGKGFLDYFVTVGEFQRIIDQLYQRNYVLVDLHQAVSGNLKVPVGKKPVVLSVDDLNYYQYLQDAGLPARLVIGDDGKLVSAFADGRKDRSADVISVLDDFVAAHPDFSLDGTKAMLNLTGYEGVFGYATQWEDGKPPAPAEVARAIQVANLLKATGWTFASHSYGHITIPERSVKRIQEDAARWNDEVAPIVGPTDVFVYPYGASVRMTSERAGALRAAGFRIFCDISGSENTTAGESWTLMSRRHIDGIGFEEQADDLADFFDVSSVIDTAARG
jgi:hypothetical protein